MEATRLTRAGRGRGHEEAYRNRVAHGTMCFGEKAPAAKLTAVDVAQIVDEWANGETQTEIAERYGVSWSTVHRIVKGRMWQHLRLVTAPPS